ncbi:uncharacterized protein LOC119678951 isoform X2 [Teleopsis dalmanni]|uniref:uncharacterized protein LOC119678951 isoform X2 n=1 Tax=Teleopsis dalmanni TaxID=139649 RepID=UPI0018CEC496|nr:uncharacterized protein LOC119678951 isoform X2 [Teleopsis dalmanni]
MSVDEKSSVQSKVNSLDVTILTEENTKTGAINIPSGNFIEIKRDLKDQEHYSEQIMSNQETECFGGDMSDIMIEDNNLVEIETENDVLEDSNKVISLSKDTIMTTLNITPDQLIADFLGDSTCETIFNDSSTSLVHDSLVNASFDKLNNSDDLMYFAECTSVKPDALIGTLKMTPEQYTDVILADNTKFIPDESEKILLVKTFDKPSYFEESKHSAKVRSIEVEAPKELVGNFNVLNKGDSISELIEELELSFNASIDESNDMDDFINFNEKDVTEITLIDDAISVLNENKIIACNESFDKASNLDMSTNSDKVRAIEKEDPEEFIADLNVVNKGDSVSEIMLIDGETLSLNESLKKSSYLNKLVNYAEIESLEHEEPTGGINTAFKQCANDFNHLDKGDPISEVIEEKESPFKVSFEEAIDTDDFIISNKGDIADTTLIGNTISTGNENEETLLKPFPWKPSSFDNIIRSAELKFVGKEAPKEFTVESNLFNKGNPILEKSLEKWKHCIVPINNKLTVRLLCMHHAYKNKFWVVNESSYCDLIELELNMAKKVFIPLEEEAIESSNGELIATRINNRFHRSVIKRIETRKKLLQVYLIDWGARKTVEYFQVFEAQNFMENFYAFSFLMELSETLPFVHHMLLKIKLLRKRSNDNCVIAHLLAIPPQPEMIPSERSGPIEVKPYRIMNGGTCGLFNLRGNQLSKTFYWNFRVDFSVNDRYKSQHECGSIVLVHVRGLCWSRARIISTIYKSGQYLVYLIDDGVIMVVKSLKMANENEAKYPAKKIYILTADKEPTFANLSENDKIFVVALNLAWENNIIPCVMLINGNLKIKVFVTELPVLEQSSWIEPIRENEVVTISHVETISKVCVTAYYSHWYSDILNTIEHNLTVFNEHETISVGDHLLVMRYEKTFSFRGKVASINLESNTYNIFAIDFGYIVENIERTHLRKTNLIISLFPLSQKKVVLSKIFKVETENSQIIVEESKALQQLKKLSSKHMLYNIHYCDIRDDMQLVDIRQRHTVASVIGNLIPFLSVKEEDNVFEYHTFYRCYIPMDTIVRLYIVNASTFLDGYIFASYYRNDNGRDDVERIQNYCNTLERSHEMKNNLLMQVCCVYNSAKDAWERALFMKYSNDTATVINIDDHTVREVKAYDILPYYKSLSQLLNTCQFFIKDFSNLNEDTRLKVMNKLKSLSYIDVFVLFGDGIVPLIGKRIFHIILNYAELLDSEGDQNQNNSKPCK